MAKTFDFYTLENGVRVVLAPMQGVESVACGVYVKTGSRYEQPPINGLSHFLEHMVFKGTKKFPTSRDTTRLEGLGAIQNAWTDIGATAYWCKIPADKWQDGLEVAKELALYPVFPAKDLEIERGVVLEEIKRRNDRPDEIAQELLQQTMFPHNPLGFTTLGEAQVIKTVPRKAFLDYHQEQYVSGRIVVVIAGQMSGIEAKIRRQIEDWFGKLRPGKGRDFAPVTKKQNRAVVKVQRKDLANQAHVCLGLRGYNASDPHRFASSLLTTHLGQGLSSRLFLELREKRGLCYAVRADEDRLEDVGIWGVYVGTGIETLEKALAGVLQELDRAKDKRLTTKELAEAKEKVRGPLLFSKENPMHQMEFYARQALDRPQEVLAYDAVIDRLMGLTTKDVQQVAQDLFKTPKLNLAVVGPVPKKQEDHLLKLLRV